MTPALLTRKMSHRAYGIECSKNPKLLLNIAPLFAFLEESAKISPYEI